MKKQFGLKNLSVFLAAGLLVGACSPMEASVSKLSNASTPKNTPSDSSSTSNTATATGTLLAARDTDADSPDTTAQQQTVIQGTYDYKSQDLARATRPSMELDKESLDEFMGNLDVQFNSNDPRVKGREDTLSNAHLNIVLAMHPVEPEKLDGVSLDDIQATLKWHPDTAKWELSIVPPSTGDGNEDVTRYNQIRDIIHNYLTYVAVVFKASSR